MTEQLEQTPNLHTDEHLPEPVNGSNGTVTAEAPVEAPVVVNGRHAAAGRKGAERIHQLIQRGRLYEQEHGLKRGRQRLRQLIEEGKLYEEEHGLTTSRRKKRDRVRPEQLVHRLLDSLVRLSKPAYRPQLLKLMQALENEAK
jgi:hypothetical protein